MNVMNLTLPEHAGVCVMNSREDGFSLTMPTLLHAFSPKCLRTEC